MAKQAAEGDSGAKSLMIGLRSLSTQLSGAQVGITVTTLALGFVMQPAIASLVAVPLEAIGLSAITAETVGLLLGAVDRDRAVHGVRRVGAEEHRDRRTAGDRQDRHHPDADLHDAVQAADRGAQRHRQRGAADDRRRAAGGAAVRPVGGRAATRWSADPPRRARWRSRPPGLLARSISFSGKTADDVLTPRVRVRFVKAADTADAVIAAAVETGHSRFPVSGEDSDDVVGLVHLKRAVAIPPDERATVLVEQLIVPVPIVPGSMPLDDLLDQLRERGLQMAVVADEYGGTAGILTLEDVVEELVGEIKDEHDPVGRPRRVPARTTPGCCPASLRPDEIAEFTGVHLPESGAYETVAGLLISRLGRMPENFDSVEVVATMDASVVPRCARRSGRAGPTTSRSPPNLEDDLPRAGHRAADGAPPGPAPDRLGGAVRGRTSTATRTTTTIRRTDRDR